MHSVDNYDDLNELIDEDTTDDSAELFQQATTYVQSAAGRLDNDTLLKLYALYKQATEGACKAENRPGLFNFRAKAKFDAWHALRDMSKSVACASYVDTVRSLGHDFLGAKIKNGGGGWVTHSTLQQCAATDEEEGLGQTTTDTHTRTLLDLISADDVPALTHHLTLHPHLLHDTHTLPHSPLLTPCHYAADRGAARVLRHLLTLCAESVSGGGVRAALDARDSDGQTPLHYAAACGHVDCCRVLLSFGARVGVTDREGCTCLDVATEGAVRELLGEGGGKDVGEGEGDSG